LTCELLKKIKCFRSLKFLDSDYINHLRYTQSETKNMHSSTNRSFSEPVKRNSSTLNNNNNNNNPEVQRITSIDEDEEYKLIKGNDLQGQSKKMNLNKQKKLTFKYKQRKLSSASGHSNANGSSCCACLFTNQRNDFFSDSRRSRSLRLKKLNSNNNKRNSIRLDTNCSKCNQNKLDSCKCLESAL
jgi:hypothetical protein